MKILGKFLVDPSELNCVNYNNVNIFNYPVYQIFFWRNTLDNTFFSLYKYYDKYIIIKDDKGDIYDLFKEDTDEDTLCEIILYLFKNISIYDNLYNIKLNSFRNDDLVNNLKNVLLYVK